MTICHEKYDPDISYIILRYNFICTNDQLNMKNSLINQEFFYLEINERSYETLIFKTKYVIN